MLSTQINFSWNVQQLIIGQSFRLPTYYLVQLTPPLYYCTAAAENQLCLCCILTIDRYLSDSHRLFLHMQDLHLIKPRQSGVLVIPFSLPFPSSINLAMHNERFLVTVVVIHRRDESDC